MKIVILAGGLSTERDVSLSSSCLIANALMKKGHGVALVDVYEGVEIQDQDYNALFFTAEQKEYSFAVPKEEPDLEELKRKCNNGNALVGKNVIEICKYADIVFMGLHGSIGENGQIQAMFDILGIRYTGTGYVGSLLAMDKDLTKKLLRQSEILTANWILYDIKQEQITKVTNTLQFPVVVKPCNNGSSVGVSIAKNEQELDVAIQAAKKYEDTLLIEEYVKGREFSVGVLNGKALPSIEIIPREGFYDYKNKYQPGFTEEICPGNLSEEQERRAGETALQIHRALRLGSYSRIDLILREDDEFVCLEANTLPGMTPTSLLPQEAKADGISYEDLCERIMELAK